MTVETAARTGFGWWVRLILKIVAIVVLVGGVAISALALLVIGNLPKAPTSTLAPVAWATREVQLTPDRPLVTGRITLSAPTVSAGGLRVGVNAGAPSAANPAPGAALAGPVVRLRATAGDASTGTPTSCLAPCELIVPASFDCSGATCRMTIDVTVELLGAGAASGGPVTLTVSGGANGPATAPLASPFTVEVTFDAGT